ncbi:MAG: DUF3849 domain-containing protein [Oscillospiraceae bacterium]|nr:DUF3849 domain-containing protein [Oscillospiraceae bacterium]
MDETILEKAERLTIELYEKMRTEQNKYRSWLETQPLEDILNHAHEYTVREDFMTLLANNHLEAAQAEALLTSPTPLADLYKKWGDLGFNNMSDIWDCIESRANDVIQQREKLYQTPVYKFSFEYAKENGELGQHRASHEANIACKKAIETAISDHHRGFSFDSRAAVRDVVEKFGYERTLCVLAVTIRNKEHDGRFSNSSKNWARTLPVCEDTNNLGRDYNREFVVQSHPALTEDFVTTARHEYLLSLPLTKDDIKAEALDILSKFQNAREPNSPNRTHYMAQVSHDFLARAKTRDTDRLIAMLPFRSLSLSGLEGHKGTFALISKDENRFQKLVLRRPSVRKNLQEKSNVPKEKLHNKTKHSQQER